MSEQVVMDAVMEIVMKVKGKKTISTQALQSFEDFKCSGIVMLFFDERLQLIPVCGVETHTLMTSVGKVPDHVVEILKKNFPQFYNQMKETGSFG